MNNRYLFVTTLTPKRLLTPLRKALFDQFLLALKSQSYQQWDAILIGEENFVDGKIKYMSIGAESKEIKLIFAKEYILNLKDKPDYIIRIDDDDIINPELLKTLNGLDFDCYADCYHSFYDITTGKISQQKRSWLANTVVHKYIHAMEEIGEDRIPLIQSDHSKEWIAYYHDKKLLFSDKTDPVYLRVLSPTTVTSGLVVTDAIKVDEAYRKFMTKAATYINMSDIDFKEYSTYLKGFGKWKYTYIKNFKDNQERLDKLWADFSKTNRNHNLLTKIRIKWNSLMG